PSIPKSVDAGDPTDLASPPPAVPDGAYAPAIIVLLTDGASNAGPEPVEAAQQAADRGLRVYTIGFGTADPGANRATCGAQFGGTEPGDNGQAGGFGPGPGDPNFGGGFGNGPGGFRRGIGEGTLKAGADAARRERYPA